MRRALAVMLIALVAASLQSPTTAAPDKAASRGVWLPPIAEDALFAKRPPKTPKESMRVPTAVSMAMLPDGRVIYWGGLESLEDANFPLALDSARAITNSRSRILDLRDGTPRWSIPKPQDGGSHDMFCADLRLMPDGRLLVVGGTFWKNDPLNLRPVTGEDGPGGTGELFGSPSVRTFDYRTDRWTVQKNWMNISRWYPSLVTLADGRYLVVSGVERLIYNDRGLNVHETETLNPATGRWKNNGSGGATSLPLFARIHLLPDGKVFYSGNAQMWGPFGQAADEALWHLQKAYDPKRNAWTVYGTGRFGARSGALEAMLPLKPPYKEAQILQAGGTLLTSPGSYLANRFTEIVTVRDGRSTSEVGPDLNNARWYSSAVLLPNGHVVAVSGGDKDEVIDPGSETPVRQAEMFNGRRWVRLATARRIRTYHNSAILLPDGSVLVGGHAPINDGYGPKGTREPRGGLTGTNNLKDPSFEILKPPYLFGGDRPVIRRVQEGLAWGRSFDIHTEDARGVEKVVLMRLPTTTHITDADMRGVELRFRTTARDRLLVEAPPNGSVAPPGYYYVFILSADGKKLIPSKAHIVRVGQRETHVPALAPMGR